MHIHCIYVYIHVYLLADEGDLCIWVPDLVTFVKNDVIPFPVQEVVTIDSHSSIGGDENTVT